MSVSGGTADMPQLSVDPIRTSGAGRTASILRPHSNNVLLDACCLPNPPTLKLSHLSRPGGQEHARIEPVYAGRRASGRLLK
jgi:hypothetical protein